MIKKKIETAYRKLIKYDSYLLTNSANERSITHKLGEYLKEEFLEYDVDCEYNLNGLDPKKISSFKKNIESDNTDAVSVYPDIIIHKRGTTENFIVIEAKKSSNKNKDDNEKLSNYKNDLGYKHAFFIIFPVAEQFNLKFKLDNLIEEIKP
ncbi:MAG: hypothetical protein A2X12_09280 [Bacteroidetes bacterium GWE2_29_8]|nr:MAG: hypothetical protein A2X12_09280 [Bacteroidetes bacterium GWE2_29_8]OFY18060.1 MAG: hypothetical protein A2X02_05745 [Bacteroidetes bacterium GWF2_29_10]